MLLKQIDHPRLRLRLHKLIVGGAITAGVYPNIAFARMPFKILEYEAVMRVCPPAAEHTVLDIGCGPGLQTLLLARQCRRAVGVDTSQEMIDRAKWCARRLVPRLDATFMCSTIEDARLPEGSFDTAYSFSVIEHIPNYDEVLRETCRVLKPGGRFVFTTDWLATISNEALRERHGRDHHVVRYFSPVEISEALLTVGFEDVRVTPLFITDAARDLFEYGISHAFDYGLIGWRRRLKRLREWEKAAVVRSEGLYLLVECSRPIQNAILNNVSAPLISVARSDA